MKTIQLYQSPVHFVSDEHRYFLQDKELQGVTGSLIKRAFPDKYSDVDEETLAKAAEKGQMLHSLIELHDSIGAQSDDERVKSYQAWKERNGYTAIANEYLVSDELYYASSIDIVLQESDNSVVLVDIKTTYKLDRASTALQLSIYKRWFERQNPTIKVSKIIALWLPNKDHTICEAVELPEVDAESIDRLIWADQNGEEFSWNTPQDILGVIRTYNQLQAEVSVLQEKIDDCKRIVQEYMEHHGRSSIKTEQYTITYIPPKTTKKFNSAKFKAEQGDMYTSYIEDVTTKPQIRFLTNKQN